MTKTGDLDFTTSRLFLEMNVLYVQRAISGTSSTTTRSIGSDNPIRQIICTFIFASDYLLYLSQMGILLK